MLENFARDVERQIVGVDDPDDETGPLRDNFLAIIHHENTLDVEAHTPMLHPESKLEGRAARHVEQSREFLGPFNLEMRARERGLVPAVGQVTIELVVLLGRDVGLWPLPEGAGAVDRLVLGLRVGAASSSDEELDGMVDVVRIAFDE